jgi:hypothetical protein
VSTLDPAFLGHLCRYCARPRATDAARAVADSTGDYSMWNEANGQNRLCWNLDENACGAWLKPHEAYELAVKDVVAWLSELGKASHSFDPFAFAAGIEAGAHFGKAGRK